VKNNKILIVEQEHFLADVLEGILRRELNYLDLSIQSTDCLSDVMGEASTLPYDVVLVDLSGSTSYWPEATRIIEAGFPRTRVVFVGDPNDFISHDLGGSSYTLVPRVSTAISAAVREVLSGAPEAI
jgi:DNA-binding NarL/FixJ family response regulator